MKSFLYLASFILLDILIPRTDKGGCSCSSHNYPDDEPQFYQSENTEQTVTEADAIETDAVRLTEE